MRRILSYLILFCMVMILLSCNRKDHNNTSSGSNVLSENLSMEQKMISSPSDLASEDSTSSDTLSSKTTSSRGKGNNTSSDKTNNSTSSQTNTVDMASRAKSTDIGTKISDGYVFYTVSISNKNHYSGEPGIYKKKLGTDEAPIKIGSEGVVDFQVLNNYVYYIYVYYNKFGVYRMDTNGQNVQQLNDGYYQAMNVAGEWIFLQRQNRLYMLRTDGSELRCLQPKDNFFDNKTGSVMYGFDRGFFYYQAYDYITTEEQTPGSISIQGIYHYNRIDYRSKNPVPEDFGYKLSLDMSKVVSVCDGKIFTRERNGVGIIDIDTRAYKIIENLPSSGIRCNSNYIVCNVENKSIIIYNILSGESKVIDTYFDVYNSKADILNNCLFWIRENKDKEYLKLNMDGTIETIYTLKYTA